jgi:pimeloyl-ACP methyl ester carboxylesterase
LYIGDVNFFNKATLIALGVFALVSGVVAGNAEATGTSRASLSTAHDARAVGGAAELSVRKRGDATAGRAVVVIEGGGSPHPFTTPWAACDGGRQHFVEDLAAAGLPVFTAPGFGNSYGSTAGSTGCPRQPPLDVQWNTFGYPTQAGQAVLGFLGYLHAAYGYRTFDLVGYSYGGVVARATVAALKQQAAPASMAPAFSYATAAVRAGIRIPSVTTLNSPHLGSPTYDIASDPRAFYGPVASAWGTQFAEAGMGLVPYERDGGAGSIHVLKTDAHAKPDPTSWDAQQVGVLDGVALTLIAGNYCGRSCGDANTPPDAEPKGRLRTDGTVPVYSQLMQPCTAACLAPPGSVYLPPGLLPANVVRKTFATVHSKFDTKRLGLAVERSSSVNPAATGYLRDSVLARWRAARAPLLSRP